VAETFTTAGTAGLARMIERAAEAAGLELKAHPHMLRHACGYALANKGHDTRAIQGWLAYGSIRTGSMTSGGIEASSGASNARAARLQGG
jgi:site-specific recombinase XerD